MLSTRPRSGKKSLPRVAARHMVSCQQQARPNVGNPRCSPTLPPPALLARCLLALSEPRLRAPFVRPERPFVRTRPSAAPPELGPAHRPDRPTTRGPRAGLEGRWGARRPPPSGGAAAQPHHRRPRNREATTRAVLGRRRNFLVLLRTGFAGVAPVCSDRASAHAAAAVGGGRQPPRTGRFDWRRASARFDFG